MAVDWTVEADAASALRARGVESDLSDAALHDFARDAVAALDRRLGELTNVVRPAYTTEGATYVFLTTPAATITSVEEAGSLLTVDDDYRVMFGGRALERIGAGWSYPVTITHTAEAPDADTYDRIVTDLVKLAITYQGHPKSIQDGDHSQSASLTADGYQREREALISELVPLRWGVAG